MDVIKRIAKNTTALIIANITNMILGMLYGIYTARYLGAEGYGIISFSLAFINLFTIFGDIGLQQLMLREVARDKSLLGKYFGNILTTKIFLVLLAYTIIIVIINTLGYPESTIRIVYIMGISMICGTFTSLFNSVFQAFEKMEYVSLGSILSSSLMLAGGIFAVSQELPIISFALIYSFSSIIVLTYAVIIGIRIGIPFRIHSDLPFIYHTLKRALPFGMGNLFLVYYVWIDRVMLSYMMDNSTVGYYTAAYNIMGVFSFVPNSFVSALFPVMSISFRDSDESLIEIFHKGIKYLYLLALPMALGVTLLRSEIVELIYGSGFIPSEKPLAILIWAEFFVFLDVLLGNMLLSINKERWTMLSSGLGAFLNIALNLILIPNYGMIGAAVATFATEFFFFLFSFSLLARCGYTIKLRKLIPKPAFSSAIMSLFILELRDLPIYLIIPISILLYFILIYLTKYLSQDDMRILKNLLPIKWCGGNT